jgi:hypothetical protein
MSDIRESGMNVAGHHFGPTGAMNDESTSAMGSLTGMLMGAPMNAKGGSSGQQSPRSGASDLM